MAISSGTEFAERFGVSTGFAALGTEALGTEALGTEALGTEAWGTEGRETGPGTGGRGTEGRGTVETWLGTLAAWLSSRSVILHVSWGSDFSRSLECYACQIAFAE